jgi:hypothetical protein
MAQTHGIISAKQIQRETGVTYQRAWRMGNEVRIDPGENAGFFQEQLNLTNNSLVPPSIILLPPP